MILVSIAPLKTPGDGVFKAEFPDGSSLLFSADYLPRDENIPAVGVELSPAGEEAFRFAAACYRAEKTAFRLISRAEQNSTALAFKLECRGHDSGAVKEVISSLAAKNLLDDRRYAERWIRSCLAAGKPRSPRWFLASLHRRGISRDFSREALETVLDQDTEYALLLRYLVKNKTPKDGRTGYIRNSLKYEGFSRAVLDRYFDDF